MRHIHALAVASAALLAAGCERQPAPAPANTIAAAEAAATDKTLTERIEALPPAQLRVVLFRAIRDAKQPCQGIAEHRRIDDRDGRPAWSARCDRGDGDYLLVLNPAGQMVVTPGKALL